MSKETDEQLIEITAKGKNKMPGYEKSLKDAEIESWSLISVSSAKKNKRIVHISVLKRQCAGGFGSA